MTIKVKGEMVVDDDKNWVGNPISNVAFGSDENTVCKGDDSRLSDPRPASDVSDWAKQSLLRTSDVPVLDASKITSGTIDIERIPHAAIEKLHVVSNQAARLNLTKTQVQNGDTVKESDTGLLYFVVNDTKLNQVSGYEIYTAGSASSVSWSGVTDKPTTFTPTSHDNSSHSTNYAAETVTLTAGTGLIGGGNLSTNRTFSIKFGNTATTVCKGDDSRLSDARSASDVSNWAKQPSLKALDVPVLDASKITSGTIDIDRLPHAAIERLHVVSNQSARLNNLTKAQVQNGDTVKESDTGLLFFVVDDTKLNQTAGYESYTAGSASSVHWAGVTDKPTTFTPTSHDNSAHSTNYAAETVTLTAGTGLTGGGNLSTNRTFSVNFGNTENTVCKGDDSRLSDPRTPTSHDNSAHSTNYAAETVTLIAGTGLTGGGNLSTNRSFSVNFGIEQGTVCQGNDPRLIKSIDSMGIDNFFNSLEISNITYDTFGNIQTIEYVNGYMITINMNATTKNITSITYYAENETIINTKYLSYDNYGNLYMFSWAS